MKKSLVYLDYLIRGVAILGIIPFGYLGLGFSIMGAAGNMNAFYLSFGLICLFVCLIAVSAIINKKSIDKLPKIFRKIIVVRLPAYLFFLLSIWLIWNMVG